MTKEDKPSMNWRKGLFRTWLWLSVAWVIGNMAIVGFVDPGYPTRVGFLTAAVFMTGPPAIILLLSIGVFWVTRGFKGH